MPGSKVLGHKSLQEGGSGGQAPPYQSLASEVPDLGF